MKRSFFSRSTRIVPPGEDGVVSSPGDTPRGVIRRFRGRGGKIAGLVTAGATVVAGAALGFAASPAANAATCADSGTGVCIAWSDLANAGATIPNGDAGLGTFRGIGSVAGKTGICIDPGYVTPTSLSEISTQDMWAAALIAIAQQQTNWSNMTNDMAAAVSELLSADPNLTHNGPVIPLSVWEAANSAGGNGGINTWITTLQQDANIYAGTSARLSEIAPNQIQFGMKAGNASWIGGSSGGVATPELAGLKMDISVSDPSVTVASVQYAAGTPLYAGGPNGSAPAGVLYEDRTSPVGQDGKPDVITLNNPNNVNFTVTMQINAAIPNLDGTVTQLQPDVANGQYFVLWDQSGSQSVQIPVTGGAQQSATTQIANTSGPTGGTSDILTDTVTGTTGSAVSDYLYYAPAGQTLTCSQSQLVNDPNNPDTVTIPAGGGSATTPGIVQDTSAGGTWGYVIAYMVNGTNTTSNCGDPTETLTFTPGNTSPVYPSVLSQIGLSSQTPGPGVSFMDAVTVNIPTNSSGIPYDSSQDSVTDALYYAPLGEQLTCSASQLVAGTQQSQNGPFTAPSDTFSMSAGTVDTTAGGTWGYLISYTSPNGQVNGPSCGDPSETITIQTTPTPTPTPSTPVTTPTPPGAPQVTTAISASSTAAGAGVTISDGVNVTLDPAWDASGDTVTDALYHAPAGQTLTCDAGSEVGGSAQTITGPVNGNQTMSAVTVDTTAGGTWGYQASYTSAATGQTIWSSTCGDPSETITVSPTPNTPTVATTISESTTTPGKGVAFSDGVNVTLDPRWDASKDTVTDGLYYAAKGQALTCTPSELVAGSNQTITGPVNGNQTMSAVTVDTTAGGTWGYQASYTSAATGQTIWTSTCGDPSETIAISATPAVTTTAQTTSTDVTATNGKATVWDNWAASGIPTGDVLVDTPYLVKKGQAIACTNNSIANAYTSTLAEGSSTGRTPNLEVSLSDGDTVVWSEGIKNSTGGWDVPQKCGSAGETTVFTQVHISTITQTATSAPDANGNVQVKDEIVVTGTVPATGVTIKDGLYYSATGALNCSNTPVDVATVPITKSGTYYTQTYTVNVAKGGNLGWLEKAYLTGNLSNVITQGQCGDKTETTNFGGNGSALVFTGANSQWATYAGGTAILLLIAGGIAIGVGARRRRKNDSA